MTDPSPTSNGKPSKQIIATLHGARWDIEFEGVVNQREMNMLKRTLLTSYVRAQRRARVKRVISSNPIVQAPKHQESSSATVKPTK